MKKFLAFFICVALCLGAVVVPALATEADFVIENGRLIKYNGLGGAVVIPEGVKVIADEVFSPTVSITSITIPNSVTQIEFHAFGGLNELKSITIPSSVTQLDYGAFYMCFGLSEINVAGSNPCFTSKDGVLFSKDMTKLISYPENKKDSQYTIPNSVVEIGENAFFGCMNLRSVIIPSSVTKIGSCAFNECNNLSAISIPPGLTDFGANCFLQTAWTNAKTGQLIIVNNILIDCRITSGAIVIPNNVVKIGDRAFSGSAYCGGVTSITIPSSVTKIGIGAFDGCDGLTSLNIPSGVTEIGEEAFTGCSNLASISFPDSIHSIGRAALSGCHSLTAVVLPSHLTKIDSQLFSHCRGLRSVTIPKGVTEIGMWAFEDCTSLRDVYFSGTEAEWMQIKIDDYNEPLHSAKVHCQPTPVAGFTDVLETDYYANAVTWAVEKNITSGTSATTFSPNTACTRAQAVTFLWRAAGQPEPAGDATFADVQPGSYYDKAVCWAVEKGIASGTGNGKFSPDEVCSRAQIVTLLYRFEGSPDASGGSFSDVPTSAYYADAVAWGVSKGITSGTGDGKFSPNANCTRAQIVTLLYRDMEGE